MSKDNHGQAYHLLGGCAYDIAGHIPTDDYLNLQWVAVAYIKAILGPPPGERQFDVLRATHHYPDTFMIVIAITSNSQYDAEMDKYFSQASTLLDHFSSNVKWENLTREAVSGLLAGQDDSGNIAG